MIKISSDTIDETIRYLEENYPSDKPVYLHIAEGADCIETPDGIGFGVFIPEASSIYIAEDIPEKETALIETIAHEYKHFLQHCNNEPFNDEAAEKFAIGVRRELRKEG